MNPWVRGFLKTAEAGLSEKQRNLFDPELKDQVVKEKEDDDTDTKRDHVLTDQTVSQFDRI